MSARSWTAPALWRFGKDHVLQSPAADAARKAAQVLRVTKHWGILGATRRAAVLFGSRFVARSSQTTAGMLVARRLAGAENPSRQTVSYFGNTTLGFDRLKSISGLLPRLDADRFN